MNEADEALANAVASLCARLESGAIRPVDFVAGYILRFMEKRFPQGKYLTLRNPPMRPDAINSYPVVALGVSKDEKEPWIEINNPNIEKLRISQVDGLQFTRRMADKLKKLCGSDDPTVVDIFKYCNLRGVQQCVNESIVNWDVGKRPYRVYYYMPSVEDVFNMQTRGERCITIFVKKEELGRLMKDQYPPYAEMDALHFLIHDIQHMERFTDPKFYCEQVGLLHRMRHSPFITALIERYDDSFHADLDHAISDMNACCTHLLGFFKTKWKLAEARKINPLSFEDRKDNSAKDSAEGEKEEEEEKRKEKKKKENLLFLGEEGEARFEKEYEDLLREWGMEGQALEAAKRLCFASFSLDDAVILRKHFHDEGQRVLGLEFAFFADDKKENKKKKKDEVNDNKDEKQQVEEEETEEEKKLRETNRGRKRKALQKQNTVQE